ncbi:cyanobacterial phytochrome A [Leptolyngbya sp. 'hensonii']|uniref:ATP-binding protein n=1 Tax=Leptolyngbya sp. 'hensonii' TaxID=1922337 RepID=UPI0009501FE6|nr:ATP-binding protein [Leptolyngbya sp. 'hensonii']OLP16842.1 cyanobacterial phytochrome A [Leptolyngbya sp. 'hensonii']
MIDLTNCDREPIHIPGFIQPHGLLLVLSEPDLTVEQVSDNGAALMGIPSQDLLGRPLSTWLGDATVLSIHACLAGNFEYLNPLKVTIGQGDQASLMNGIVHRSLANKIILELEPLCTTADQDFLGFYQQTHRVLSRMQQAISLQDLCTLVVKDIRAIVGFDRVMIYRFEADGSGTVVAEDKPDHLESYLGLHYPDSDIPKQAKHLYSVNWLRLIPDVNYTPVKIIRAEGEQEESSPLDLSLSVLRAVSPIHIEYLHNMGVRASMSISLIKNQKLWGLIACHHTTPYFVSYETRTICEFLGRVMSLELIAKEEQENLEDRIRLKSIQSRLIDEIARSESFVDGLIQNLANLRSLTRAEGVAVYADRNLVTIGQTPAEDELLNLIEWLPNQFQHNLFITHGLSALYPPAMAFKEQASGLLALSITRIQKNYVLWFRPELLQHVNWAGNPHKQAHREPDGTLTLFPRKSFELWQETVTGQSLPWQPGEIEGAMELRSAIVGIVLRRADELAAINLELQRSNSELDAFAYIASHDLKEPLRGIHNYATFLLEDYASVLDIEGVAKLETLVNLTCRMENLINALLHFSRLGRQELHFSSLDLNQLVQNVVEVLRIGQESSQIEIRIPQPLPRVQGDRILLEEVLTNLIGNGLKYNDQPEKWIEVGCLPQSEPASTDTDAVQSSLRTFYIRDNGIGMREKHLGVIFRIFKRLHAPSRYGGGTGVGLTIVKKIIERHGGEIWVESTYGAGSTFYFTLPV